MVQCKDAVRLEGTDAVLGEVRGDASGVAIAGDVRILAPRFAGPKDFLNYFSVYFEREKSNVTSVSTTWFVGLT
jgi:hypothetical protein